MRWLAIGAAGLALAACSQKSGGPAEKLATYDVASPAVTPAAPPAAGATPAPIAVSVPQMAYDYHYTFRLDGDRIAAAQQRHVALCDRLGPARCQILSMQSGADDDAATTAQLKLHVASGLAREFGASLQAAVAQSGGRTVASTIAAEDVSKQISDTDARLRQRTLLVERLTEILRTRQGKVAELVEAERSVAAAQEEIDQAKSWLAELRGRVAMSTMTVDYQAVAAAPASPRSGLGEAVSESWSFFVIGLEAIARLAIFLLPWALIAGLATLGVRHLRRTRGGGGEPPPIA